MKILFTLFFILMSSISLASSVDERRSSILKIIDQELSEIRRLSNQTGNRNPDHLLRIAELYLEKARLYKDKENEDYLKLSDEDRRKLNKKTFFKTSDSYFKAADEVCLRIAKNFKNYRNIGDVYYILAFNAKELNDEVKAQKYFSLANKNSSKNSQTQVKSNISLAEIYYNQKKYAKAIPLYEAALKNVDDKWYTKDAFNLAWCYFRVNRSSDSISKMIEVYNKSKQSKYVDMSSQIERDIGLFYATSGRIGEGIDFYKKLNRDFVGELIAIASKLKDEGLYLKAQEVLNQALKYEKNDNSKSKIYAEQLELFDKYGKTGLHLKASEALLVLVKNKRASDFEEKRLKYFSEKYGATLQKQVASKTYKDIPKTLKSKANMANRYFEILRELEPKRNSEIYFLQGETAYASNQLEDAVKYYDLSYESAKKENNKKFLVASLDGMLVVAGDKNLKSSLKKENTVKSFERFLEIEQKSEKAYKIYPRLFNSYFDSKDLVNAEKTLERFAQNYQGDYKTQEAMLAKLMDYERKNKNNEKFKAYVQDINNQKYKVTKGYAETLKKHLTAMEMEDVQNSMNKGDKKLALIGYHNILKNQTATDEAKTKAKYNLAALYYELGATKEMYLWGVESLKSMSSKDILEFSDTFLAISMYLFGKIILEPSSDLSYRLLAKLCNEKTAKKSVAFKNSAYLSLANHDVSRTEDVLALGKRCGISSLELTQVKIELLKDYFEQKKYEQYDSLASELSLSREAYSEAIVAFHNLSVLHRNHGNQNQERHYLSKRDALYSKAVKEKVALKIDALDIMVDKEISSLHLISSKLSNIILSFPEASFNAKLKQKLNLLDQLTTEASKVQKIGSGKGIVESYKILSQAYTKTSVEINQFSPPNVSEEYIKSFKSALANLVSTLQNQGQHFLKEGKIAINNNNILRDENFSLYALETQGLQVRFWHPNSAIIMDREGAR